MRKLINQRQQVQGMMSGTGKAGQQTTMIYDCKNSAPTVEAQTTTVEFDWKKYNRWRQRGVFRAMVTTTVYEAHH